MKDIQQFISPFIQDQFPRHYSEGDRAAIVDFVEAFYEFIEENSDTSFAKSRGMFQLRDVDTTLDEFIFYFREKYLEDLPYDFATDDEFAIKKIIDLYRSKGSEKSVKLLIRLLFNEDASVYYPAKDILRASHSIWKEPKYLELTRTSRTKNFIGTRITGAQSNASALVESLVTKKDGGKFIDILYLSNISGDFITGEFISDNGSIQNAPRVIGSLSSVDANRGGANYAVGDRLSIISDQGRNGVARVSEVLSRSDTVSFDLLNGGYGYSIDDSSVYVSTAILFTDNANLEFDVFETVTQNLELVTTNTEISANIGDVVIGYDSANNQVANGEIVFVNDGANSFTIETKTGTFEKRFTLTLQEENRFAPGETIQEEDNVELEVTSLTAPFINGEEILQRELIGGLYQSVAVGILKQVALNTFTVDDAFGEFKAGLQVEGLDSGSFANIVSVNYTSSGTSGEIISSTANTIVIRPFGDDFVANNTIRGDTSKNINTVIDVQSEGLTQVEVNGATESVIFYEDKTASGFVVGQDEDKVGIYGNTNPFYFENNTTNEIKGDFGTKEITRIGKGTGATFDIGSLNPDTIETANIVSTLITGENIFDVEYLDLLVDGTNSGVTRLSSNVEILDGGTGYSNGDSITFTGGGYDGGEPLIDARGTIVTDANGSITDVNITDPGQGYNDTPDYFIPSGVGANLVFAVEAGYGFEQDVFAGLDDIIDDALADRSVTIGEIASIKNINSGVGYDTGVFVRVVNEEISDFNIKDEVLTFENLVGTFANGEVLVGSTSGAKGRVEEVNNDNNTTKIKDLSFNNQFVIGETVTGETSTSTATLKSKKELGSELSMGENASFGSFVSFSDGVISKVEVIDSGYGYRNDYPITLYNSNNEVATTGTSFVEKQGKGLGFWKTRSSHLNEKFLRDSFFYQEHSYQVITSLLFEKYEQIVRDVIHVAGTELFGRVEIGSFVNNNYDAISSIILGENIIADGAFIGDPNVANTPFTLVGLDGSNSRVGRLEEQVIIYDAGIGYTNGSVTLIGGGKDGAEPDVPGEAVIITDDDGRIFDLQINEVGEGYYSVPDFILPGPGTGANVEISVELGYGFIRDPFSDINNIIGDTLGSGQKFFVEKEVLFDG